MKRNVTSVLLTASFLLFLKLDCRAQSDSTFIIKGVIDTVPHATYFVTYQQRGNWVNDTISLNADRRFEYVGIIGEPTRFSLTVKNDINPNLAGNLYLYSFWVEPGKSLFFEGKANWLFEGVYGPVPRSGNFILENSDMEITASRYSESRRVARQKREEAAGRSLTKTEGAQLADSLRFDFIKRNPDNYFSLNLLYGQLRGSNPNYTLAEELMDAFTTQLKSTYLAKELEQRILVDKLTGIGRVMPDFSQRDTAGNLFNLSDFRGKYVLVDFWASWCGPCRAENPNLVKAYKAYSSKGFDILGISLDESKAQWLKAIGNDGLTWTHLSDLKGFDNEVAKKFFIHAIPENFLLDPNGVIIAKNVKGVALMKKLENIFAQN
ncbi:TlpA family protein disulfide reductase [Parapedobacter tibetensis]|uniref:TlpA family protein disulfide reductase n=1 Tax=Parapedobacter tibetensis TaxID=2972951 RepID=UPI00214DEC3D|nr:TlpA disulfide reductase family protein [Parapedobacter tibetensis]